MQRSLHVSDGAHKQHCHSMSFHALNFEVQVKLHVCQCMPCFRASAPRKMDILVAASASSA